MTGSAVAGLVVLNSPGLQGQPCTETSRQRQNLLKALGFYFLKLAWLYLGLFFSPAFSVNPVSQLGRGDLEHDAPLVL